MYVYILKCKDNKYSILTADKQLDKPLEHFQLHNPVEILGFFKKEIFIAGNIIGQFVQKYGLDNVRIDESLKNEHKELPAIVRRDQQPIICITCTKCGENGHSQHSCKRNSDLMCMNCFKVDHITDDCPHEKNYQYWS